MLSFLCTPSVHYICFICLIRYDLNTYGRRAHERCGTSIPSATDCSPMNTTGTGTLRLSTRRRECNKYRYHHCGSEFRSQTEVMDHLSRYHLEATYPIRYLEWTWVARILGACQWGHVWPVRNVDICDPSEFKRREIAVPEWSANYFKNLDYVLTLHRYFHLRHACYP